MTIKVGDTLPDGTLYEYYDAPEGVCVVGPNAFTVKDLTAGRKVVIFAVPGAFTPGCSKTHLPGFIRLAEAIRAEGVADILCVAVNDAFVMGAWGREQGAHGKVRLLGDGSATWTTALGLDLDLVAKGLGVRSQRYAMIVDDGVVKHLAIDVAGKIEASTAEAVLAVLRAG
ncbi:peroxiredoxin [Derxia gummosa]|uniref:Glutathione-dependent peroxiredoxin n=1 Tax=Derxia gummosa DSM 723 TaxID=1121388 RepID=A0A8B6X0P0_9BURK|nr:peroxiredoxin [Derxia gummosa]